MTLKKTLATKITKIQYRLEALTHFVSRQTILKKEYLTSIKMKAIKLKPDLHYLDITQQKKAQSKMSMAAQKF